MIDYITYLVVSKVLLDNRQTSQQYIVIFLTCGFFEICEKIFQLSLCGYVTLYTLFQSRGKFKFSSTTIRPRSHSCTRTQRQLTYFLVRIEYRIECIFLFITQSPFIKHNIGQTTIDVPINN